MEPELIGQFDPEWLVALSQPRIDLLDRIRDVVRSEFRLSPEFGRADQSEVATALLATQGRTGQLVQVPSFPFFGNAQAKHNPPLLRYSLIISFVMALYRTIAISRPQASQIAVTSRCAGSSAAPNNSPCLTLTASCPMHLRESELVDGCHLCVSVSQHRFLGSQVHGSLL